MARRRHLDLAASPRRLSALELGYPNAVPKTVVVIAASGLLGAGAALAVPACGEERGDVEVQGRTGGTGTGGRTAGTGTVPRGGTNTVPTTPTGTAPRNGSR